MHVCSYKIIIEAITYIKNGKCISVNIFLICPKAFQYIGGVGDCETKAAVTL